MSEQLGLQGVIPPMTTPLTTSGEIDIEATERHVEYLIRGGVNGIFVLGTSGEGPWLTADQCKAVMETAVRAAGGRVPVLGGALEPSTRKTLEAVERAAACGVDGVVVTTPYYFTVDAEIQRIHFEAIARSSTLPVVLYNIPVMTHNVIMPATVAELMDNEIIVGIKDSAGDMQAFEALLALRERRADFKVLQGAERLSAQALLAGADGIVPGLGNVAPELFADLVTCARTGDTLRAVSIQQQVDTLWHLHTYGFLLACLKYAISLVSECGSTNCAGLELSESSKIAIRTLVESAGLRLRMQPEPAAR